LNKHKARLLALPGCTGVAIGYKEVAGEVIDRLAIVVFVERKQKGIAADCLVPAILDGIPTDVVEKTFGYKLTATDPFARFTQMFSGISITPLGNPDGWGTLGCIIHTTGNAHVPGGNYLLTNQHVLSKADPNQPGNRSTVVLQPGSADKPPADYACGDYVYGVEDDINDCAIATIGRGRTWRNEVPNHPWRPGRRTLAGVAAAAVGDEVYKYGATTNSTRGVVRFVHADYPDIRIRDAIYIESLDGSMWVGTGDSGSILIRYSDDFVLGLNCAADHATELPANSHPPLHDRMPAYSAGYAYDIQRQMNVFGGVVTLAPNP
jgi:hypothetical protein